MKILIATIVLLLIQQNVNAGITLEFNDLKSSDSQHLIRFNIDQGQLIFTESGSKRINTYTQSNQQFKSYDPDTNKTAMINEHILANRITKLNQKRLKKLQKVQAQLESKLQNMNTEEQKVGETLINVLKYPKIYGDHNQLQLIPANQSKTIQNISCNVYQLYRENQLLKDYCISNHQALNMSKQDYQTLRSFYAFDYSMQSRLMLAMGNTRFELIDFEQQKVPGVIIETIYYQQDKAVQHLILKSLTLN